MASKALLGKGFVAADTKHLRHFSGKQEMVGRAERESKRLL